MKYAGKKVGLMPKGGDTESAAEDKGENEATESKTIKKTGNFKGKPNKLGGGGRFAQMTAQGKSPALAAYISRKVYGRAKTQQMAAAGRKSA